MRMTVPGHCACLMGMVLYASATSRTAACDPAGRWRMVVQMVSKVPHVHGKFDDIMSALIARMASLFVYGAEKFWMIRYLPGFCGLGMMDTGDVWNGPRRFSTWCREKGPSYLPLSNSSLTDCWKMLLCTEVLSSLGGV